jgi:hypothetical protein
MDFGHKLTIMRWIRDIKVDTLAKKIQLDSGILSGIVRGDLVATASLERRIRQALGWPTEVDEMLEIIARATYKNSDGVTPAPKPEPKIEAAPIVTQITPLTPQQAQVLKKKIGRPRKARPEDDKIEDDGEVIDMGELRGSVVG